MDNVFPGRSGVASTTKTAQLKNCSHVVAFLLSALQPFGRRTFQFRDQLFIFRKNHGNIGAFSCRVLCSHD